MTYIAPRSLLAQTLPVAASPPASQPLAFHQAASARAGGDDDGGHGGGGGLGGILHRIFSPRTIMFAGLGAVAATAIPPLAFLGGPVGGAIAGALLSMII